MIPKLRNLIITSLYFKSFYLLIFHTTTNYENILALLLYLFTATRNIKRETYIYILTLIWVGFLGSRFEVGGGVKLPPLPNSRTT